MNIVDRAKAPTPKFFRILRTVGLTLLAISGSVLAAPVALPAAVVSVAGYLAVAGGVISAVSQITVKDEMLRDVDSVESPDSKALSPRFQHDKNENDGTDSQPNHRDLKWYFFEYPTSAKFPGYFGDGGSGDGWSYYQFFGVLVIEMGAGGFQKVVESLKVKSSEVELFLMEEGLKSE